MARVLFLCGVVVAVMVGAVNSQAGCRFSVPDEKILDLNINKLSDQEAINKVKDANFARTVFDCYTGKIPCATCGKEAEEVIALMPFLLKGCGHVRGCTPELNRRASLIGRTIAKQYPKEFSQLLSAAGAR